MSRLADEGKDHEGPLRFFGAENFFVATSVHPFFQHILFSLTGYSVIKSNTRLTSSGKGEKKIQSIQEATTEHFFMMLDRVTGKVFCKS